MSDTWIENWLGGPRFQRYLSACDQDHRLALELYDWNAELSSALMHDLGAFEVALRNAYDRAITRNFHNHRHWLIDYESPFLKPYWKPSNSKLIDENEKIRRTILSAIESAGGIDSTPGKILAEFTLGFWNQLTEQRFEKIYWVPFINYAFTKGMDRGEIHQSITNMRLLRNRIAHHEPVFDFKPQHHHLEPPRSFAELLRITGALSPQLSQRVCERSRTLEIYEQRPV